MTKIRNKGQSLIESVFAVAVVMLILSGIVVLLINSVGARSKSFDRQIGTYVAQTVIERLIENKKNNSSNFWARFDEKDYSSETGEVLGNGYEDYPYDVNYHEILNDDADYPNCNQGSIVDCVEISVTVKWKDGKEYLTVRRFFSR